VLDNQNVTPWNERFLKNNWRYRSQNAWGMVLKWNEIDAKVQSMAVL
jgi:hypothetical protein